MIDINSCITKIGDSLEKIVKSYLEVNNCDNLLNPYRETIQITDNYRLEVYIVYNNIISILYSRQNGIEYKEVFDKIEIPGNSVIEIGKVILSLTSEIIQYIYFNQDFCIMCCNRIKYKKNVNKDNKICQNCITSNELFNRIYIKSIYKRDMLFLILKHNKNRINSDSNSYFYLCDRNHIIYHCDYEVLEKTESGERLCNQYNKYGFNCNGLISTGPFRLYGENKEIYDQIIVVLDGLARPRDALK